MEDFPEARKPAYKLKIDFGELGVKRSSAQIKDLYTKEELLGEQVRGVVNLPQKQIAASKILMKVSTFVLVLLTVSQPKPGGTMHAVRKQTAEHYTWGSNSDGWHLLKDEKLSVIEEQMPPGASEVLHYHRQAQQFFYMLTGEAVMEIESARIQLAAGEGIHVPAGVNHRIRNESQKSIRFLVISQPPSHGDRVLVETNR